MVQLKAYQKGPVKFMKNNKGLILFHSTGSGKTLTSLFAMYQFNKPIVIIGPKSSRKAFDDNILKANMDSSRFTFYSFKKIKNLVQEDTDIFKDKSIIIDEAHNLRNETTNNLFLISALSLAYKIILLTATPVINYLNDLSVLVNIVKDNEALPTDRHLFANMYYDEDNIGIINQDIIMKKLGNCISYYFQKDNDDFPMYKTEEIEIEMNDAQLKEYVYYVKQIIMEGKENNKSNPYEIDFSTLDKKKKNFFLSATRQLSNTVKDTISPKILAIYNKIKKGPYPAIVYSNFLKNGIYSLATLLEKNNITYTSITGNSTDDKINMVVNNYNSGKYQVLLLSSAGSESLDLKNTRQIHIMEPHWNEAKITQVIGRSIRYKSHNMLSKKDRNVIIYRWISIFPKKILNSSADQYLANLSKKKHELFNNFIDIIKKVSIERVIKGGYLI